jgi:hypothetical protein
VRKKPGGDLHLAEGDIVREAPVLDCFAVFLTAKDESRHGSARAGEGPIDAPDGGHEDDRCHYAKKDLLHRRTISRGRPPVDL